MKTNYSYSSIFMILTTLIWSCGVPSITLKSDDTKIPAAYTNSSDTLNSAQLSWRNYFSDPNLIALIDSGLNKNQELRMILQEIEISKNEVKARKGEYLPSLGIIAGGGMEKPGKYTRDGAVEEQLTIKPGQRFPEPFSDFTLGVQATWEIDWWKKLRNARKSAVMRYLASIEGKNFMTTQLVAEIAESYYELQALDNLLQIIQQNNEIQSNALRVIKQQKDAAKVTQLAVNRFEAQLLNTQNLQYAIKQKIVEVENRINYLSGRYPQPVSRNSTQFLQLAPSKVSEGIPPQLLGLRPDIKQAEMALVAANLDVKVARAHFYPSLGIKAGLGFQAFNPAYLLDAHSLAYQAGGDLVAPLINRNAIKANYLSAGAKQIQAAYKYQQTVLNAYVDVVNQLAKIENYSKSFETKNKEVEILTQSISIANNLFFSARADYAEVLLTQREALDAKMEEVEIKMKEMHASIQLYRALGGGWK